MIDSMFIIDIAFTFLTPYERHDGSYEHRFKNIAKAYLSGGFIIDFFSSIPTNLFGSSDNSGSNKLLRLARI